IVADEHDSDGGVLDLLSDLLADVAGIVALDGIEEVSTDEVESKTIVVPHEVEALGCQLIGMLVADEDPAYHDNLSTLSWASVSTSLRRRDRISEKPCS